MLPEATFWLATMKTIISKALETYHSVEHAKRPVDQDKMWGQLGPSQWRHRATCLQHQVDLGSRVVRPLHLDPLDRVQKFEASI